MSQYILINRIKVQNANAIAGFTWGFPAITHFLGFTHNLARKLAGMDNFKGVNFSGCAVIAHKHHVHTYRSYDIEFTQSRNPPYLGSHDKASTPPVIEEGKMNMTVSLLFGFEGEIGHREDDFIKWLTKTCLLQRLAGGTILSISNIGVYGSSDDGIRAIKRKLLPGFILKDQSSYLENNHLKLKKENTETELLDAWLDFSAFKQKARPKSNLITKHLNNLLKNNADILEYKQLADSWEEHLKNPYKQSAIPQGLIDYFSELDDSKSNKKLQEQWSNYCLPNEATSADWEYVPKPESGYLVPIMIGYKAITPIYENSEVGNTRDDETEVCFVESAHSVGEWLSVHHLKNTDALNDCLWHYQYEKNWYLCTQNKITTQEPVANNPDDDY